MADLNNWLRNFSRNRQTHINQNPPPPPSPSTAAAITDPNHHSSFPIDTATAESPTVRVTTPTDILPPPLPTPSARTTPNSSPSRHRLRPFESLRRVSSSLLGSSTTAATTTTGNDQHGHGHGHSHAHSYFPPGFHSFKTSSSSHHASPSSLRTPPPLGALPLSELDPASEKDGGLSRILVGRRGEASTWHNPNLMQMVETLRAVMISKRDSLEPIPVVYNSYVLSLIEGFAGLTTKLEKRSEELEELKRLREMELEQFRGISEEWMMREENYKKEIKRLELVLASESEEGVGRVKLVREGSLVERGKGVGRRFRERCERISGGSFDGGEGRGVGVMNGGGNTGTHPEFALNSSTDREGGRNIQGSQYNVISELPRRMDKDRDVQMSRAVESQDANGLNQHRSPQQRQRDRRSDQRRREASTHADDEPGSPGARSRESQDRSSRFTVTPDNRENCVTAETRPKQKRDSDDCGGLITETTTSPPTNWYPRDASDSSITSGDESLTTAADESAEHSGMGEPNTTDTMLKVRPGEGFTDSDMEPYDSAGANRYEPTAAKSSTKRPWDSVQRINASHDRRGEGVASDLQKRHGSRDAEGNASQGHDATSEGSQYTSLLRGYRGAHASSARRPRRRSYSFDEGNDDILQVTSPSLGIDSQNVATNTEIVTSRGPANDSDSGRQLSGRENVNFGTPGKTGATAMAGTPEPAKKGNKRPSLVTPSNSTGSVVWIGGGAGAVEHKDGEAVTETSVAVYASGGRSESSIPRIVVTKVDSARSDGMSRESLAKQGEEESRSVSLRRGSSGVTPTPPGSGGGRVSEAARIAAARAVGIHGSDGRNK